MPKRLARTRSKKLPTQANVPGVRSAQPNDDESPAVVLPPYALRDLQLDLTLYAYYAASYIASGVLRAALTEAYALLKPCKAAVR
jgi:hypothetical protein